MNVNEISNKNYERLWIPGEMAKKNDTHTPREGLGTNSERFLDS